MWRRMGGESRGGGGWGGQHFLLFCRRKNKRNTQTS
jgi:hypothetical protein